MYWHPSIFLRFFTFLSAFCRTSKLSNISNFSHFKRNDWHFWTPMIITNQEIIIRAQLTSMRVKVSSSTMWAVSLVLYQNSLFRNHFAYQNMINECMAWTVNYLSKLLPDRTPYSSNLRYIYGNRMWPKLKIQLIASWLIVESKLNHLSY